MTQSTEMKYFQEEQYQLWLELNKEYLVRFLKENLSIMTDYTSCGGSEYRYDIYLCTEDDGSFSQDSIYCLSN